MRVNGHDQAGSILTLSELVIEEELCINLRGRMVHCTNCRDSCPSDALSLTPDSVDLDSEKCTGCNSCLQSCSAGALRSTGFVPERFILGHSGQDEIHLHCRASTDDGGGIVIPCHAVLDARLLAASRAEGVKTLVLHGLNNCDHCMLGDARAHIESVCSVIQAWMGEEAMVVDTSSQFDNQSGVRQYQDQPHMSRRDFLKSGSAKVITQAADWMVPGLGRDEVDEEALPFYQAGDYPQRPSQFQQVLASRVQRVPWLDGAVLPWKMRTVNDNCSACLSCGERCPTGALQAHETADARQLSFDIAYCTDCGLCERICPEMAMISNSIKSPESVSSGRSVLLHQRQCQCGQCGTSFVPDSLEVELCPVCRNELDLDEEWLEMLSS
jgi:ferredoxin